MPPDLLPFDHPLSKAILLRDTGRHSEMRVLLESRLRDDPAEAEALALLGHLLLLEMRDAEAVAAIDRAAALSPSSPQVLRSIVRVRLRQGRLDEAEAAARAAYVQSDEVETRLLVAAVAMARNQLDEAGQLVEAALTLQPGAPQALLQRAALHLRRQNPAKAMEDARAALHAAPHLAQGWRLLTGLCQQGGDREGAIQALLRYHTLLPHDVSVLVDLGELLRQARRFDEAEAALRRAIAGMVPAAWANLGVLLQETGRPEEARVAYDKALAIDPENAQVLCNLGVMHQTASRHAEALVCFKRAATLKPDSAELQTRFAAALLRAGCNHEAEATLRHTLRLNPRQGEALMALAGLVRGRGLFDEAATLIRQTLAINPKQPQSHLALGATLFRAERFLEAEASYREALRLQPDFWAALTGLAGSLMAQERFEEAVRSLQQALTLRPENVGQRTTLGDMLLRLGRHEEADVAYQKALALEPGSPEARMGRAGVLVSQERFEEAVSLLREAATLRPDKAEYHAALASALQATERHWESMAAYQEAIRLKPDESAWQLRRHLSLPSIADSTAALTGLRRDFAAALERSDYPNGSVPDPEQRFGCTFFSLAYHGADDRPLMEGVARIFRRTSPSLNWTAPRLQDRSAAGRIRLGILSRYLYGHTIGKLTRGFVQHLDRDRFHVTVLHTSRTKRDRVREDIDRLADHVVELPATLSKAQEQVAALNLHILHYPDIGMDPFSYFLAYARLAPVQTVGWGHPVTTGLDSIDYFLSFGAAEPSGAEAHYTETLVRLTRPPAHYEAFLIPRQGLPRSAFGLPDTGRLYGCPQSLFKFHPDFDPVLAEILTCDPQGWVVALDAQLPGLKAALQARWARTAPVLTERVLFLPRQPLERFMQLLPHFDVLLDPPHFGSGNTLYESLMYGIPSVTWPGRFMRGRIVAGIYSLIGLEDAPVAEQLDDYARLAVDIAGDQERRERLRRELLDKAVSLYQDMMAVREFEAFLEAAVEAAASGQKLSEWTWQPPK